MEERKEEGEAEIQEHGPEHWFSKWERQCLAEAEQDEQLPPELQEEAAAAAQPEHKQQKLWHLFQNSATAVAQLYKGKARRRHLAAAAAPPLLPPPPPPRLGVGGSVENPEGGRPPASWAGPGLRAPAARSPPPHKMAAWGAGPAGGGGRAGGRRGGRSRLGPLSGARPRLRPGCWRPPGREGRGGAPGHKMAKGGGGAGPLCPKPASGRGLGGGASLGRGRSRGCASGPRGSPLLPPRPLACRPRSSVWDPEALEQNGET